MNSIITSPAPLWVKLVALGVMFIFGIAIFILVIRLRINNEVNKNDKATKEINDFTKENKDE